MGIPRMRAMLWAVGMKGSVQTTAVGIPRPSKVTPSCRLHEEQEPQSPLEVMIISQREANSCTTSWGQGRDAVGLDRWMMVANS